MTGRRRTLSRHDQKPGANASAARMLIGCMNQIVVMP
jgi:hypothetical protein